MGGQRQPKNVISYALAWEHGGTSESLRGMVKIKVTFPEYARIETDLNGLIATEIELIGGQWQPKV